MGDLALVDDGDGFEPAVGMFSDPSVVAVAGRELGRPCIIQQQEWAQCLAVVVIAEKGADRKAVPDPVRLGSAVDTDDVFHCNSPSRRISLSLIDETTNCTFGGSCRTLRSATM